jgi:hypothetical protein
VCDPEWLERGAGDAPPAIAEASLAVAAPAVSIAVASPPHAGDPMSGPSSAAAAPVARARDLRRRLLLVLLLGAVGGLPAAGQVSPTKTQRVEPKRPEAPQLAVGDLVITTVSVAGSFIPTPSIIAQVWVKNAGAVPVTVPTGSVLVRGDAAQPGGIAFAPLVATADFTLAPGQTKPLSLTLDPCAAGKAGAVNFRVDPDNRVRESDKSNNTFTVSSVTTFADADLVPTFVDLFTQGPTGSGSGPNKPGTPSAYPANLVVSINLSPASGRLVWCPGVALWRETQSPLSGKYGLRTLKNEGSTPIVLGPQAGGALQNAFAAGDLTPGQYTWKVLVNPDGKIRETNTGNNAITATITIK